MSGYLGQAAITICYPEGPACPQVCQMNDGTWREVWSTNCPVGGMPGAGGAGAGGCAPGYEEYQGTCVPKQAGLIPNVPASTGPQVRTGFPWPGLDLGLRLPDVMINWLKKYGWWLLGGVAALAVVSGSGNGGSRRRY